MPVPSEALTDSLNFFKTAWESAKCPVCGQDKWKNSAFCRRCSIRLQRKNLLRPMDKWYRHSIKAICRFYRAAAPDFLYGWLTWYDRCLDYLCTSHCN